MLDRIDFDPLFFAPFVSSVMTVEPGWIDYNGHLNMAYYNVLFDRAVDEAFLLVGLGPTYAHNMAASYFTAETHQRFVRELKLGDRVRVTLQLLGYDAKRMHFYQELYHAADGWVAATSEQMALHVDLINKRVKPFPDDILTRLALMKRAHDALKRPDAAGRRIEMPPHL